MSGSYCAVAECHNSSGKARKNNLKTSFHRFPRDERRTLWINACKRGDKFNANQSYICSDHFDEVDFQEDMKARIMGLPPKRLLKSTAVPSLKLPPKCIKKKIKVSRYLKVKIPSMQDNLNSPAASTSSSTVCTSEIENVNIDSDLSQSNESLEDLLLQKQTEIDSLKHQLALITERVLSLEAQLLKYSGIDYRRANEFLQCFNSFNFN